MKIKSAFFSLSVFGLLLVLSGCAIVIGPQTVVLSRQELQQKLITLFPVQSERNTFIVSLHDPELILLPNANRLELVVRTSVRNELLGREIQGVLKVNFGLQFNPENFSLQLVNVKIDEIAIDGLPAKVEQLIAGLGSALAQHRLEGHVLHQFKPADLGVAGKLGYTVKAIEVHSDGLAVLLIPKS